MYYGRRKRQSIYEILWQTSKSPSIGIFYGIGKQQSSKVKDKEKLTYDTLSDGMEVRVEVDRRKCTVVFTLKGPSKKWNVEKR